MSVLNVYRRKGGGYLLSHEPMETTHSTVGARSFARIGVVESETFGANLGEEVAHQLAQRSQAFVSAKLFDE